MKPLLCLPLLAACAPQPIINYDAALSKLDSITATTRQWCDSWGYPVANADPGDCRSEEREEPETIALDAVAPDRDPEICKPEDW